MKSKKKFSTGRYVVFLLIACVCTLLSANDTIQSAATGCAYLFAIITIVDIFTSDKITRDLYNLVGVCLGVTVIIGIVRSFLHQDFTIPSIFYTVCIFGIFLGGLGFYVEAKIGEEEEESLSKMTLQEAIEIAAKAPGPLEPLSPREQRAYELLRQHFKEKQAQSRRSQH